MRFLSSKAHTIIGLVVGILLLFAPQLLGFSQSTPASMTAIWTGIFIIVSELVTTSQYSPLKLIPMRIHLILDYLTGIFLALSPWLFGFSNEAANVWVPHVVVGILVVAYAAVTNPTVDVKEGVAEK